MIIYKKIDGELVSRPWFRLLTDLRAAGVQFHVNEGHRTLARQAWFWMCFITKKCNGGHLAARPSNDAPHIRTGRFNHAVDFNNAAGVKAAAAKRGVTLVLTVPGESWHLEAVPPSQLRAYWRKRVKEILRKRRADRRRKAKAKKEARVKHSRLVRERALRKAAPFIADFEGGKSSDGKFHAYKDPVGVWTIGFGETKGVHAGMVWSEAKAKRQLRKRLRRDFLPAVLRAVPKGHKLTANQLAAVLSFVYNLGAGVLETSHTFGRAFQAGRFNAAFDSMLLYDKAGGKALPGLTRRRKAERALALKK